MHIKGILSWLSVGILLVFFQNCSNDAGFVVEPSEAQKFDAPLLIENGSQFTNKKVVSVEINLPAQDFTSMRTSKTEDFSASDVVPYSSTFSHDLGDDWADDGSKDGPKTVYVELRPSIGPPTILNQTIGLDTVFPSIVPEGILAEGMQGVVIPEGDQQNLAWQGEDVPAANGFSSGLDLTSGIKVGYTPNEDCSASQVELVKDWTGYTDNLSVTWPQKNPLDTFFFCIYAKDNAGNVKAVLSQPMSALWKVIVGENSQGNGGSFLSPNVRFKSPMTLAMDAQNNIYISDAHFHNLRKANGPSSSSPGEMSLLMGDGHSTNPGRTGDSLEISLRGGIQNVFFDEDNNIAYFSVSNSGTYKLEFDADRSRGQVTRIINSQKIYMTPRMYQGTKTVLMYSTADVSATTIGTPQSESYLYEIPWEEFKALEPETPMSELARYRIAGNGTVPLESYSIPATAVVGLDLDPTDMSQSVGWAAAIYADPENGDIYIASRRDGSARPWGHHTTRRLVQRDDGTFDQTLLSTAKWIKQIAKLGDRLLLARSTGFSEVDLNTLETTEPIADHDGQQVAGVWVDSSTTPATIYLAETYRSRVVAYTDAYTRILTVGRPVYVENEPNALQAMVGQPDGVVATPDGRLIYVDSLNNVVRSVSEDGGVITTLLGAPSKSIFSQPSNTPFSEVTIDGRQSSRNSYNMDLLGSFSDGREIVYLGTGARRSVIALDLAQGTANQVVPPTLENVTELDGGSRAFAVSGMALEPTSGGLFLSRTYHLGDNQPTHANYTGFLTRALVVGSSPIAPETYFAGDLSQGVENFDQEAGNSVVDAPKDDLVIRKSPSLKISDGILYSGSYGLSALDLESQTYKTLIIDGKSDAGIQQFEVFSEGDTDHIVYRQGEGLKAISIQKSALKSGTGSVEVASKQLCLPGTFLNNAKHFAKGHQGNLIISDSWNGRILKYFINSTDGLQFVECP